MKYRLNTIILLFFVFGLFGCGKSNLGFSNEIQTSSTPVWESLEADKKDPIPNKLTVQVVPAVAFDSTSEKISYSYSLTSLSSSQQAAKSFFISLNHEDPFSIEEIRCPEHWNYLIMDQDYFSFPMFDWVSVDSEPPYRIPIYGIKPGQTLSGFGFTSNGLPEIGYLYIKGWVRAVWKAEEDVENLPPQPSFPDNCFKTQTVIPVSAPPSIFDFAAFQAKMNGFINQSAELGWISSATVKADLLLQFAKVTGINQSSLKGLSAFLAALESYHGKGLNDSAYYLLKVNSQYLQNRLEGKALPRWPSLKKEKVKDPLSEAEPCIDRMAKIAEKINNSRYLENQGKGPDARKIAGSGYRCPITRKMYRIQMYQLYIYPHSFNFTLSCTGTHPGYEKGYPQVSSHDTTLCTLKSPADLKNVPGR